MTYANLVRVKADIKAVKQNPPVKLIRNILINKNYDRRLI
jgi:hypothetical protein